MSSMKLKKSSFKISAINTKQVKRNAPAPFITSTLQQEAFGKLGFNTSKTMMIAQQLYEGIEIGDEEPEGLITYMRTDSVNIAAEAIEKVRGLIKKEHGKEYLPEQPNKFKSKKSAQEAHEAIRPSDVYRKPEDVKQYLSDEQYRLYDLIWKRFISCQMMPAIFEQTKIEILAGRFQFGASGSILAFPGYLAMYMDNEEQDVKLDPSLYAEGDALIFWRSSPASILPNRRRGIRKPVWSRPWKSRALDGLPPMLPLSIPWFTVIMCCVTVAILQRRN